MRGEMRGEKVTSLELAKSQIAGQIAAITPVIRIY